MYVYVQNVRRRIERYPENVFAVIPVLRSTHRRMVAAPKGGKAVVTSQDIPDQDAVFVSLGAFVAPDGLGQTVGSPLVAVGIGRAHQVRMDPAQVGRDRQTAVRFGQRAVRGSGKADCGVSVARQDLSRS